MKFVNYLPQPGITQQLDAYRSDYRQRYTEPSHSQFIAALADREVRKEPGGYLRFGPYWWALKSVLIDRGYAYGPEIDGLLASAYRVRKVTGQVDGDLTIVAAFEFRALYDATMFAGTRQFDLFGTGEFYVLDDPETENSLIQPL